MTATGITQSTSVQGGLELIRSIAESTGPQGAPRPRFFIRPSTHALQAAAAPNISVTQTMGSASTTSGPFTNTITQSASFRVPGRSVSSASSSSSGIQQVQNYQSSFPQPMQFGVSMPPLPQMPMFAQLSQSSSSSSRGIKQMQSQSQSSGPGSYSYSSSQSQSSQRSPPHLNAMAPQIAPAMPNQQASPPRDIYQQAPPQKQENRINNWVQPGSYTIHQQNLPLPPPQQIQYPQQMTIQQQQQQQLQQIIPQENSSIINQSIGATLMASTSASNAAVFHQSLQQHRMQQLMEPQRRSQNEDPHFNIMSAGSSLYGARHKHKAQHRKKSQTQHAFEDNESVEQAVEDADEEAAEERSGSDGNLDLRMLMQEMTPQRAATLQEDLLFAPQMHGQLQAEYVGQRALEAVGHLSISGTYLPFPAEFARPLVEGQSILQPPPAKINPVPFEQRLQQFKQSLMQYVKQNQVQRIEQDRQQRIKSEKIDKRRKLNAPDSWEITNNQQNQLQENEELNEQRIKSEDEQEKSMETEINNNLKMIPRKRKFKEFQSTFGNKIGNVSNKEIDKAKLILLRINEILQENDKIQNPIQMKQLIELTDKFYSIYPSIFGTKDKIELINSTERVNDLLLQLEQNIEGNFNNIQDFQLDHSMLRQLEPEQLELISIVLKENENEIDNSESEILEEYETQYQKQ